MSKISPAERSRSGIVLLSLAPALFVVLWSTGFIGAKLGLPYAEPATFLGMRFALVSFILGVVALIWKALWPGEWTAWSSFIMVVGLLVHGVYLGACLLELR